MKIRHYIYILAAILLTSCSDDLEQQWPLSPVQQELIGQGVNFSMSYAEPFTTRTTYRHDGSFNENDEMTIYRQYSNDNGNTFDSWTESYRVYSLKSKRAEGTDIVLSTDWKPLAGKKGSDPTAASTKDNPEFQTFDQSDADSLTWENGQTVRFRGWSRSNLANAIEGSKTNKNAYYPDYCIADWATVSGPTMSVPMTLKHQGCRIGIIAKSGNELSYAEICTDWHDYKRVDNADTNEHDTSTSESTKTDEVAQTEAASVVAVYNKMCMPAGVDMTNGVLTTMTKTMYNGTSDFSDLREKTASDGIVKMGDKDSVHVRTDVQRPVFGNNDGRLYMISIPYDMSDASTKGETLTLPACTRFRIYLYDVNNGDKTAPVNGWESNYHILTLRDVKDKNGNCPFAEGMELKPGYSYVFNVGYHYDHFDVTPADDFSWTEQSPEDGTAVDPAEAYTPNNTPYQWWKKALKDAIPTNNQQSYNPIFHITTQAEFVEFINLVNGTATYKTDGLTLVARPEKTYDKDNPVLKSDYRWYRSTDLLNGKVKTGADSVTHAVAEEEGYIFYEHYYPANADQGAYSIEDYLRGPYSFYYENQDRHFIVHLDADLDLYDVKLPSIGKTAATAFKGTFDGYDGHVVHKITNINMEDGYMFKFCNEVAIRNLYIETVHDFKLVMQSTKISNLGYGAYIVGISIKAPTSGNPIAETLTGNSYVVGCIYQGHYTGSTNGAMVGTADDLIMYGNMMAASGLPSGTGALLGAYATGAAQFLAPQTGTKLGWGRFHANYYDVELSPGTNAVGNIADAYRPQEYIRGRRSWILKAKNDNLITDKEVSFESLNAQMQEGYYGLAPWKAMNYAIYAYNLVGAEVSESMNCKSHYENDDMGYAHVYPHLVYGEPGTEAADWNILEQNN